LASDGLQWVLQRRKGKQWEGVKFIRSTKAHLADRMRQMMPAEDADRLLDGLPETFDEWRLANEAFFETADTKAAQHPVFEQFHICGKAQKELPMSNYWNKQPSSRPYIFQALGYTGNATSVPSTTFGPFTQQIRVVSEVQGWLALDSVAVVCTVASSSLKINGGVDEEYFSVNPGQAVAFNSTSTSSGMISVTEMT
jgi:hypothetical protein